MTDQTKILILAADHFELIYARFGDEMREIKNRIRSSSYSERFDIISEVSVKITDPIKLLMAFKPDILHFIGHSTPSEGIILGDEDERKDPKPLGAKDLADILTILKDNIRIVFLSVCHTKRHAEAIIELVDYAIGMDGKISDKSARAFAGYFYEALGYGRSVEEAFELARKQLKMRGLGGSNVPRLLVREKTGVEQADHQPLSHGIKPDAMLQGLGSQFVAQLRIAGHFQDTEQSQHAIYLDRNLYVHRVSTETAILLQADRFAQSVKPQGKWVSVIGDAGHGKSSLLWYIYGSLKEQERLRIVPFLAQLEGHWSKIEETALKLKSSSDDSRQLVIIIDTLDILVGIDDPSLAAMLNSLRSAGCLLITSSRRQEAERLFRITTSDVRVELKRYDDLEAEQAIRNYIDVAYPESSIRAKERQFDKVWGLIEQQRDARELDLEPLILRMLFEAYVPKDIPPDINTQQVYKNFWNERVLLDRVVKDSNERFTRKRLCLLIARQIAFGGGHSEKLSVDLLCKVWEAEQSAKFPHSTLEGLVSTGVLQWAEGASTVRFFHQTFFEYTAAYDLLSSAESVIDDRVKTLLRDVAEFNFFRAPILKQFVIQAFESGQERGQRVMSGLREVNNELAAQMALEIVGKVSGTDYLVMLCKKWIEENSDKLQGVICETVRHYPRGKTDIALSLLEPYLSGPKAGVIYSLCAETFAKDEPQMVCEFLSRRLPQIEGAGDDEKTRYREAVSSALQYGASDALAILLALFPHLKPGQQAGLLYKVAEVTSESNAASIVIFLKNIIGLVPQVRKAKQAEVWDGILKVAVMLHKESPGDGKELSRWMVGEGQWKRDQTTAMYTGMIVGPTVSDPLIVYQSLSSVASDDHYVRLLNTGILSNLHASFSCDLIEQILSLEKALYKDEARIGSLFNIVAALNSVEPAKILQFLGEWPWMETGVGTPLRRIVEYLAQADSVATKKWLFKQLASTEGPIGDKLFSSFNILSQVNINVFEVAELRQVYNIAFTSSKAIRERFSGTVGSIALIDRKLAGKIFSRVFSKEVKDCQVAAISSLVYCLDACPEFALDQGRRVLKKALATQNLGLLHSYLIVFKSLPTRHAVFLLQALDDLFTKRVLESLRDDKTFGELLAILRIFAEANPRLVFDLSKRIPLTSKAVAGGLAGLYDQVSKYSDEKPLLLEVLKSVDKVSKFSQVRMGNALNRLLPRLDHKLGGKKVVEMVLQVYKKITDEQALKTFIEAALRVPSWTEEDTGTLLQDPGLLGSVRSLLSTNRMR
jgi:hypothetical protein